MRRLVVALLFVALVPLFRPEPAFAAKSKLDQARESAKALKAKLNQVTAQLQAEEARNVSVRQAAAAARVRLRNAQAEEAAVERRLNEVRQSVKEVAIRAYIQGGLDRAASTTGIDDPMVAVRAQFLRGEVIGIQSDVADQLSATRQDLDLKRRNAEAAAKVASSRQRAVSDSVARLRASQAQQLRLVGAAESRYLASLKESELASRSRRVRGSPIDLTTVRGITVATRIAGNLERMLNAADADGMRFGGSGYRSPSGQVAARKRNCGTSNYAVYDMPSSRCHPPTAKPGQSMHEQGLAIDFTYNGSVINSHSNAGYKWLRANAGRYGFYNLPSEAWHWSVNGN